MVGGILCSPYCIKVWRKLSESGFTKLFLYMKKSKKSAAGRVEVLTLLDGVTV